MSIKKTLPALIVLVATSSLLWAFPAAWPGSSGSGQTGGRAPHNSAAETTWVDVPCGSRPTCDGVMQPGEWSDAAFITPHTTSLCDTIWFKYHLDTLYAGFKGADSFSGNQQQLYFDPNLDRASMPQADDYRLRVFIYGGVEEGVGNGSGWVGSTVSGWSYAQSATPDNWFTEWRLALSKLGIVPGTADSVGMAALVYSFAPGAGGNSWPSTFFWENPGSWGLMKSSQQWGTALLAAHPTQHDLGFAAPGDSIFWDGLTLVNTGNVSLRIDSLCLATPAFGVDSPADCDIAPDDSLMITVCFKPQTLGPAWDTLAIYAQGLLGGPLRVALSGHGCYLLEVPSGTVPKFDGTIEPEQWADAHKDTFHLEDKAGKYHNVDTFWVKYQQDTVYLVMITPSFAGFDIISHSLLFDLDCSRDEGLQDGDIRLLAASSGELVEYSAFKGSWQLESASGWQGQVAAKDHLVTMSTVPFSKLKLESEVPDTVGFAILADGELNSVYGRWPAGMDSVGPSSWALMTFGTVTGLPERPQDNRPAAALRLSGPYPNPTKGQATIEYQLTSPEKVEIKVYNIAGQLVRSTDLGRRPAGSHGLKINTASLPNGVYFLKLTAGSQIGRASCRERV